MKNVLMIGFLLFSSAAFAQGLRMRDTLAIRQPIGTFSQPALPSLTVGQPIPRDYYTKCFGFFCKQELKMQQAHIPLTFRLGSMNYCNWMEQKPGYRTPNP